MAQRLVPRLGRGSSVGEFAYAALADGLAAIQCHVEGVRAGDDPELVHQTRVATRRLRAVFGLLRDHLPARFLVLRDELAWFGRVLGEVRDLDVRIAQIGDWKPRLAAADERILGDLLAWAAEERTEARRRAIIALESDRYAHLICALREELEARSALAIPREKRLAGDVLPRLVAKRRRRLASAVGDLGPSSPPAVYHESRILAKRLRYAVELAAPLAPKAARRFANRLALVQDVLGRHQDACVALADLRARAERAVPRLSFAMGALASLFAEQAARCRARIPTVVGPALGREWRRYVSRIAA